MDNEELWSLLNLPMENCENLNYIMLTPQPALQLPPARPRHWDSYVTMQKVESSYEFDMHIDPENSLTRSNWFKDKVTGKVFVKVNQVITATVLYKRPAYNRQNLFLRGMIVFCNMDEIHLPVKRCANHRTVNEHSEVPLPHILRCCNTNTKYIGNEKAEMFGERLAFLLPLSSFANTDGMASETIKLEFLCQNSCRTGINRRATAVVFTLEDEQHEIIGKYIMPFRVCCCPKRDLALENIPKENMHIRRRGRRNQNPQPSTSEQASTSSNALQPRLQPSTCILKMPTEKLMRHVLRCAINEIHGSMVLQKSLENDELYKQCAQDVKQLLDAHTDN